MATTTGPPWSGSTDRNGTKIPAVGVPSASAAAPHGDEGAAAYHLFKIGGAVRQWRCEMIARQRDADGIIRDVESKILV